MIIIRRVIIKNNNYSSNNNDLKDGRIRDWKRNKLDLNKNRI